jgi:hypothetical protein
VKVRANRGQELLIAGYIPSKKLIHCCLSPSNAFVPSDRPGQMNASRFFFTNSSTVIGSRPPISAI